MDFLTDKQLSHYITMRLGGDAKNIVAVSSEQAVKDAALFAKSHDLDIITIGKGSNIIFGNNGFSGLVLINQIYGLKVNAVSGEIVANSGELTDKVVEASIRANLVGLEALSGIPGTIGAAPVNNIGAYGQEIKNKLIKIRAYDTKIDDFVELKASDCKFSYRDSIFKAKEYGRYIVTQLSFRLDKFRDNYQAPNYPSLLNELKNQNVTQPNLVDVRRTILKLREAKLPNPAKYANTGSFYKNPSTSKRVVGGLLKEYPDMPHYPQTDGSEKLSAAWLIDNAGLKDYRQNGFWVCDKQPLVLVNESSSNFNDLSAISNHIVNAVKEKFSVVLEIEPEIID